MEDLCSVELHSCRGSLQWINGVGDNKSGIRVRGRQKHRRGR